MTVRTPSANTVDWLYRNHYPELLSWLKFKLGDASYAADLAHDTFLRVLTRSRQQEQSQEPSQEPSPDQALQPLEQLREPRAYLHTIAHGLMVDHWRRRALEDAYIDALALQPEACAPSPEDRAIILEALEQITQMLGGLKPKVRAAFLLAQIEGQSYADIAVHMNVSIRTIERYMAEALYACHLALIKGHRPSSAS